jgi:hypothetical protein
MMKSVLPEEGKAYEYVATTMGYRAPYILGRCHEVNSISVHKAFVVPVCTRKMVQIESFMWQNWWSIK